MADTALDAEFTLDLRVAEAGQPVGNLLLSTSDNCGQTCEKDACISFTGDPS
jgi:FxLD family lantipeptide